MARLGLSPGTAPAKRKSRTRVSGVRLFVPGYHLRAKQKDRNRQTPSLESFIGSGLPDTGQQQYSR